MSGRAKVVTSWLLFLMLGYLVNVEASWGQERLGLRKDLTHYVFIAVALICLVIHIQDREHASVPDRTAPEAAKALLSRRILDPLIGFGLRCANSLYDALFRPRLFFAQIKDDSATQALTFLLTCAAVGSLVSLYSGSVAVADLWQSTIDATGRYLAATLATAIGLRAVWWVIRGSIPFRRLFVIQAYFCSSLILLGTCFMSFIEWILTTRLIGPSGTIARPLTLALLQRLPLVADCADADSLASCLSQYRLPSESALITLSVALGLLTITYYLVWAVGVLPTLRRLARVGYIRSSLAFLLFVVLSSAIGSIQVGSLSQLENDCRFEDLTAYPVLNPGPLKWTGTMTCGDFPLIDVGHRGADHWSKSQSDHNAGLLAKIGYVLSVRLFLENGAADDADPQTAVASNVQVSFHVTSASPKDYVLSATVKSDNASPIASSDMMRGGNCRIRSSEPAVLQYLPGTTSMLTSRETSRVLRLSPNDPDGKSALVIVDLPDGVLTNGVTIRKLAPGYQQSVQLFFRLAVVASSRESPSH